jgi:putative peptidoglycan lipid II flippase
VMVAVSFITFIYAKDIISVLYERGSFDAASVRSSDQFLRFFGLMLPWFVLNTLVTRVFIAGHRVSYAFYFQVGFNALLILFIWLAIRYIGVIGYPIAMVAGYAVSVTVIVFPLKKVMPFLEYGDILTHLLKVIFINAIVAGAVYFLLTDRFVFPALINVGLGTVLYFGLIISINFALKIDENINGMIRNTLTKLKVL